MVGFLSVSYPIMEDQVRENGLQCRKISHSWMIFPMKKTCFSPISQASLGSKRTNPPLGCPTKAASARSKVSARRETWHPGTAAQTCGLRRAMLMSLAHGGKNLEETWGNYGFCHQTDQIWLNMGLSCKLMQIVPPIQWSWCVLFTWKMEKNDGKGWILQEKLRWKQGLKFGGTMVKQWFEHCEKWGGKSGFSGNGRRNLTGRPMETSKLKLLNGNLTVKKNSWMYFPWFPVGIVLQNEGLCAWTLKLMVQVSLQICSPDACLTSMAKRFPADGRIKTTAGHKSSFQKSEQIPPPGIGFSSSLNNFLPSSPNKN